MLTAGGSGQAEYYGQYFGKQNKDKYIVNITKVG